MTFDEVFERVIGHEGGYTNDPTDPGGETNWGISKRSYPGVDIKNLTREGARGIYRQDFWDHLYADALPDGVAFQLFDFAVNSGIQTAIRKLQAACRVADDGHWGPVSQAALNLLSESDLILRVLAQRIRFMVKLSNWPSAGRGWMNRIANNLDYGADDSD